MDWSRLFLRDHDMRFHRHGEPVVAGRDEAGQPIPHKHRTTYGAVADRALRLGAALQALGLNPGDRVATLAVNSFRHLEAYLGVPSAGFVLHTVNIRLHPEQIAWIANHADDRYLCFDLTFLPIVEAIAAHCKTVKGFVAMADRAHMPASDRLP